VLRYITWRLFLYWLTAAARLSDVDACRRLVDVEAVPS